MESAMTKDAARPSMTTIHVIRIARVRPDSEFVGLLVGRLLHLVHQVGHSLSGLLQVSVDPTVHNVHGLFAVANQGSGADGACTGCSSIEQGLGVDR
jgi:hypothetical protein